MIDALFLDFANMALNRVLLTKQKFPSSALKIKTQQTEMARGDYFPLRQLFKKKCGLHPVSAGDAVTVSPSNPQTPAAIEDSPCAPHTGSHGVVFTPPPTSSVI